MVEATLREELHRYNLNPLEFLSVGTCGADYFKWQGTILGKPNSPFQNGLFFFSIRFAVDHPNTNPIVKFDTDIFHPVIRKDRPVKLVWSPKDTVQMLLIQLYTLFLNPNLDTIDSCEQVPDRAKLFRTNRSKFNEYAKEWTNKYAI